MSTHVSAYSFRSKAIDTIKGLAVIAMVFSHTVQFTEYKNDMVNTLRLYGDTTCLVVFLIAFGYTSVGSILTKPLNKKLLVKSVFRCLIYYLGFVIMIIPEFYFTHPIRTMMNHIFFLETVAFADFFPLFIFYTILLLSVRVLVGRKTPSVPIYIALWIILGSAIYLFGAKASNEFYLLKFSESQQYIVRMFTGCPNCINFPYFFYIIPVVVGIIYGFIAGEYKNDIRFVAGLLGCLFLASYVLIKQNVMVIVYQRWPPTIQFFLLGCILFSILYIFLSFLPRLSLVHQFFGWYGKNSFLITVLHISGYYMLTRAFHITITTEAGFILIFLIMMHLFIPVKGILLSISICYRKLTGTINSLALSRR